MDTWLYHRTESPRIFRSADEVKAAMADGWADTPAAFEAEEVPSELDELRAKAIDMGIKFDKRWGADKLAKAIEDHDDSA
jgi:hypothetical protein